MSAPFVLGSASVTPNDDGGFDVQVLSSTGAVFFAGNADTFAEAVAALVNANNVHAEMLARARTVAVNPADGPVVVQ